MDIIFDYINEKIAESIEKLKTKKPNEIWVDDIAYCRIKSILARKFPELNATKKLEPAIILGDIIHIGVEKILENKYGSLVKTEDDNSFKEKIIIDNVEYVISGRPDAILDKNGVKEIIEIKSGRDVKDPPSFNHLVQVFVYMTLLKIPRCRILYFTNKRIIEVSMSLDDAKKKIANTIMSSHTDEMDILRDLVKKWLSMKRPWATWECDYCHFQKICSGAAYSNNGYKKRNNGNNNWRR